MYQGQYTLIGSEMSMFSRKLEAQLRYQQIPFAWQFKTLEQSPDIEKRAGTRFIPLLQTPDGWMIHDTIAIGPMLSERFSDKKVIPEQPVQRALCFILEDYFNHWMPRNALHTRWCYDENLPSVSKSFGANLLLGKSIDEPLSEQELEQVANVGMMMKQSFGANACKVQGASDDQKVAQRHDFDLMLGHWREHFAKHDFLLGGRACLADFALLGPIIGHYLYDDLARSWLGNDVAMLEAYAERVYSGQTSEQAYSNDDAISETLMPMLEHCISHYHRFAAASIEAAFAGEKHFTLDLGQGEFTARAMKRLEKTRIHVQDEIIKAGAQKSVLEKLGLLDFYLA